MENFDDSCLPVPQDWVPGKCSLMQNLVVPTKPKQRRSNLDLGNMATSVRLEPHPPETAAPAKANELNLPEVLVDAGDPVSKVESVGEVAEPEVSVKEEVTPAMRPIQLSSSS